MAKQNKLKITLIRSKFGRKPNHLESIRGLGLRRINDEVIVEDTSATRGMINKIAYLIKVEEV